MLVTDTRECASWAVVARLFPQLPADYRLIESHPGDGQYDVLWLLREGRPLAQQHDVRLNRNGRIHVRTPGQSLTVVGGDNVWDSLSRGEQSVDDVCRAVLAVLDLPPAPPIEEQLHASGLPLRLWESRTYAAIAQMLSLAHGGGLRWRCWWGVEDTSGYGSKTQRAEYFQPYIDDLYDTYIRDGVPQGSPEKHWFVVDERDLPIAAFDVDGYITLPHGVGGGVDLTQGTDGDLEAQVWQLSKELVLRTLGDAPVHGATVELASAWGRCSDMDGDAHVVVGARDAHLAGWSLVVHEPDDLFEHLTPFTLGVAWGGSPGLAGRPSWNLTGIGSPRPAWQAHYLSGEAVGLRDPAGNFWSLH